MLSNAAIYIASIGGQVIINNCSFDNCSVVSSFNNKCDIIIKNCQFMSASSSIKAVSCGRLEVKNNQFAKNGKLCDCFDPTQDFDTVPYIEFDANHEGNIEIAHNKFFIGQTVPIMVSNVKQREIIDIEECEDEGWTYLLSNTDKRIIQSNEWKHVTSISHTNTFSKVAPNCAFLSFYNGQN